MCGIGGIAALRGAAPEQDQLRRMCAQLEHRGPDDDGFFLDKQVGLAMRRLAIIDLETGQQPLVNEDGSVRAIFNGEIYNFRELRDELSAGGHRFRSATDGEVIVHLWEEHGPGFASRLNGQFAIALHDGRQRRLVLVRDRLGIKPLFYSLSDEHLVFGSEIKALLASGLVPAELDLDALGQFLSWEYVPAPATLFRAVRKLEPGTELVLDLAGGTSAVTRWWSLPGWRPAADRGGPAGAPAVAEWEERVAAKIEQAVRRRLVSDVPLGAFLSGGVDSSLIVAAMGEARAFSIRFADPTYDESPWAVKVANHLELSHRLETLEPRAAELFDHLMGFMEDPIGDFSIFPTFLVSRLAREEVTVALAGDGGDELFGGYETYLAQEKARLWSRLPRPLRRGLAEPLIRALPPTGAKKGWTNKAIRFVEGMEHDERLAHARWRLFVGDALRRQLFSADALAAVSSPVESHIFELQRQAGDRPALDRDLYVDLRSYLVDNCLVKVDRMSMACSLEVRVPFLDHEMVELAFQLPPELRVARGKSKVLLKRVAARQVPKECVYRPKEGFSMPMKRWLCGELRPLMEELLDAAHLRRQGIFRVETVERLKQEHLRNRANHSHVLWGLMVFEDWARRWGAA